MEFYGLKITKSTAPNSNVFSFSFKQNVNNQVSKCDFDRLEMEFLNWRRERRDAEIPYQETRLLWDRKNPFANISDIEFR